MPKFSFKILFIDSFILNFVIAKYITLNPNIAYKHMTLCLNTKMLKQCKNAKY